MLRQMLTSKIHRATVTQADLHYVGSVTVDQDLLDAADLYPGEKVAIVDVTNGARLETYVISGPRGSGVIGINGAAARLVHPGDLVILIAYGQMNDEEARTRKPRVRFVDADNSVVGLTRALHAARSGTVLVVTKVRVDDGSTRWAQGGVAAALGPDDSPREHERDTLEAGVGLCDPDAVRVLCEEGPARLRELIDL